MISDDIKKTFRYLTDDDLAAFARLAAAKKYRARQIILEKGAQSRGIMVVREGFVSVERAHERGRIALARLGPGEVIGEISFVESGGASADVRADTDVTLDVVEEEALQSLLTSDPGLSARFFRSLSGVLAIRLAETSQRLSEMSALEVIELNQLHVPQTGQVTERQIPEPLVRAVRDFTISMQEIEQQQREDGNGDTAGDAAVATACDTLVSVVEEFTSDESLLEISYDDLLAFRDESQVGLGLGGSVLRETYPYLMASATIARCYMKPRGFADDHETIAMIYRNESEGDGTLGPAIDRWFLSRPLCSSRREMRKLVLKELGKIRPARARGRQTQITSLASGYASEILDFLASDAGSGATVTCIDRDDQALLFLAERAERRGRAERIRLLHAGLERLARGEEHCVLPPQDAIYAIGMCEHLGDDRLVELLDWANDQLAPGGSLILTALHASNPDRALVHYLLDWDLLHRSETELRALFGRSTFGAKGPKFTRDGTGANIMAVCRKAK